jgi:predicted RNA-binding protein with EMAP domain
MKIEVAHGEIIDKHTILVIKSERISEKEKLAHVQVELKALSQGVKYVYSCAENPSKLHDLVEKLKKVNEQLWEVEDELRILESNEDFGEAFILKARSVYFLNDDRAALKKNINAITGSVIVEAKSYADYSVRKRDSEE